MLQITTRQANDITVVDMTGVLDTETSGYAYDEMAKLTSDEPKKVLLNVEGLEYMSSVGIRVLLTTAKLFKASQGEMKICQPNKMIREVLEISGFNVLLKIYDSEKEALDAF